MEKKSTGVFSIRFTFDDISLWADELYESILKFHTKYNIYPNIMSTTKKIYQQIDAQIQDDTENIVDENGDHPEPGQKISLSAFSTENCSLEFTLNEIIVDAFLLLFDEDPTFDGEPVKIGNGNIEVMKYNVA